MDSGLSDISANPFDFCSGKDGFFLELSWEFFNTSFRNRRISYLHPKSMLILSMDMAPIESTQHLLSY